MKSEIEKILSGLPKDVAPAIVTYMSYSGLGVVRCLGRRGIPILSLDSNKESIGMNSRYTYPIICPDVVEDPDGYLNFLIEIGKALPTPAVLYPTGDNTVLFFNQHWDQLSPYYLWVHPSKDLAEPLVTKSGLAHQADLHGLPSPKTLFPASLQEVRSVAGEIRYPVIIKPDVSSTWRYGAAYAYVGNRKVIRVENKEELIREFEQLYPICPNMVIQEIIPGEDSELFYACFYVDKKGEVPGFFLGRKLRLFPIRFGSASFVEAVEHQELREKISVFLSKIKYNGLGGIEFKRDQRDGSFQLIEFNVRYGLWDVMGARCGVDLALMAYKDAVCEPVPFVSTYRTGVKWISLERDIAAFLGYKKEGILSTSSWIRSLIGQKQCAVFDWRDLSPFFKTGRCYISEKGRSIFRKIFGKK